MMKFLREDVFSIRRVTGEGGCQFWAPEFLCDLRRRSTVSLVPPWKMLPVFLMKNDWLRNRGKCAPSTCRRAVADSARGRSRIWKHISKGRPCGGGLCLHAKPRNSDTAFVSFSLAWVFVFWLAVIDNLVPVERSRLSVILGWVGEGGSQIRFRNRVRTEMHWRWEGAESDCMSSSQIEDLLSVQSYQ